MMPGKALCKWVAIACLLCCKLLEAKTLTFMNTSFDGVLITMCNRPFQYWVALIMFIFELSCYIHPWF